MTAKILTFWEWAKTKGIEYSSPWTRQQYEDYVKAAKIAAEPEPTAEPVKPEEYVKEAPTAVPLEPVVVKVKPKFTIVTRSQQVRTAALQPEPAYSRVVILQTDIPAPIGGNNWAITPMLGNRLMLLRIDVWIQTVGQGAFLEGLLAITSGIGADVDGEVVRERWDNVLDVTRLDVRGIRFFCCEKHLQFEMKKLYIGESQRFGIYSENLGIKAYNVLAAFQIAEG